MSSGYKNIVLIHSIDDSTAFLNCFKELAPDGYLLVEPNDESIHNVIEKVKSIQPLSLIIFLGHGHSFGLSSPKSETYKERIIINAVIGNNIFNKHDVLLLSCKSAEFIKHLNTYNSIIGFGNIISSLKEVTDEADYVTGKFRDLSADDIDYFNQSYVKAIMTSLTLLINMKITFGGLPQWISYFINKEINLVLRQRDKHNRIEIATLLFEFRNEMIHKTN